MALARTEHGDGSHDPNDHAAATPEEAPTGQLLAGAVGDRCVNCGAPLAADQHYCIHCGERRGKSRFGAQETSGQTVQTTTHVTPPPAQASPRRPSYGTTLVAGVATLLLAMGVGVEIGRISNSNNGGSKAAAAPSVITVNGGGASTGTTTAGGAQSPAGNTHHVHHVAAAPKTEVKKAQQAAAAPKPTQQAVQKASNAASSVLGGATGQSNATVTTGQSCAAGSSGCQGGHFTGTFFGQ